jgi:tyrosyl-tRNA synthetase
MIRKLYGDDNQACGLTINLLTKSDGTKFGKSESGAIYLEPKYTTPYQMYQFLFNQPDSDVEKLLKYLTFFTENEIKNIMQEHNGAPAKHFAQKQLANAIIKDIHGEAELKKCINISESLFAGDLASLDHATLLEALKGTPTFHADKDTYSVIDLLVACNIVSSKSQGRQLVESKAIYVNNELIDKIDVPINKKSALNHHFSYIRKGKKNYYLVIWK